MKTGKIHTVNVSITLPKNLREVARKAASEEHRSLSGLVAVLLKEHLSSEGYLPTRRRTSGIES